MTRRGLALITVLWVLTLLSLIAASFSTSTRTEVRQAFNQAASARAEALADAGLNTAILGLLSARPGYEWRADGTVYGWDFGEGEIRVSIRDEGGKIDLNAASETLLQSLFVAVGQSSSDAAALVARIVDFRDTNDLRGLNGAEDRDYRDQGLPYGAKDAPFETVEELRQVLGMTPDLYEAVAPALTVHARQRLPHEPTAPALVKAAMAGETPSGLGIPGEGGELQSETPDGFNAEAIVPRAPPVNGIEDGEGEAEIVARSRVNVFTVHAEARIEPGAVFAREAVVEIGTAAEPPYDIWAWRQGSRTLFPLVGESQ